MLNLLFYLNTVIENHFPKYFKKIQEPVNRTFSSYLWTVAHSTLSQKKMFSSFLLSCSIVYSNFVTVENEIAARISAIFTKTNPFTSENLKLLTKEFQFSCHWKIDGAWHTLSSMLLHGWHHRSVTYDVILFKNGGWSGGALVLGKLPVPERPSYSV